MAEFTFRERTLSGVIRKCLEQFPAVVISGPRQAGKTTLVRQLCGATHRFVSLDDPAVRQLAVADPALLLSRLRPPLILDEIQYAPELLSLLKLDIDKHREVKGRFVITGSQTFPLMQGVSESLAGRTAVLSLQSMSLREILGDPAADAPWRDLLFPQDPGARTPAPAEPDVLARQLYRGSFPEPALNPDIDARLWYSGYLQTYLERDVRSLRAVGDLHDFERFLFALAARSGSLINHSDLARDLGVTAKTVRAWTSLLETSGQAVTLKPYHVNLGKRLVQRPKVFFLDTGLLGYLLGIESHAQVLQGACAGAMIESAAFGQLYRLIIHRGVLPRIYFWRTAGGHEVDFVVEEGEKLIPIEVKLTATPRPRDAAAVEEFQGLFGRRAGPGILICLCRERFPLTRTVEAVPLGGF